MNLESLRMTSTPRVLISYTREVNQGSEDGGEITVHRRIRWVPLQPVFLKIAASDASTGQSSGEARYVYLTIIIIIPVRSNL